jgi:hypothetical protein
MCACPIASLFLSCSLNIHSRVTGVRHPDDDDEARRWLLPEAAEP